MRQCIRACAILPALKCASIMRSWCAMFFSDLVIEQPIAVRHQKARPHEQQREKDRAPHSSTSHINSGARLITR